MVGKPCLLLLSSLLVISPFTTFAFTTPQCFSGNYNIQDAITGTAVKMFPNPEDESLSSSSSSSSSSSMDEKMRMQFVRSLQASFYGTAELLEERAELDLDTGILTNLPLWRVGWVELPGRTNVLNVHEGQYTHMFEQVIRGPQPWYVGHLYMHGGSQNLKGTPLEPWEDYENISRTAPVGTLLQVTDYRRHDDGRLMIFVQALERFVIDSVIQSMPYSIANVQLLTENQLDFPDNLNESQCHQEWIKAIQTDFAFHEYEYASSKLPLPKVSDDVYLVAGDKRGKLNMMDIVSVFPYAQYNINSTVLNNVLDKVAGIQIPETKLETTTPFLEKQLIAKDILKEFKSPMQRSMQELEQEVWFALRDYFKKVYMPSPFMNILPVELQFILRSVAFLPNAELLPPVSPLKYPPHRRQKRLSYAAAGLCDRTLWQSFLEIATTKERLEAVLDHLNALGYGLSGNNEIPAKSLL